MQNTTKREEKLERKNYVHRNTVEIGLVFFVNNTYYFTYSCKHIVLYFECYRDAKDKGKGD